MKAVNFPEANIKIPHLNSIPALLVEEGKVKCFVLAMQPSEEDIKEINAGKPIYFQVYREVLPFAIYTTNKDGKPNI